MPSLAPDRGPHPCLERRCGHPEAEHWSTPELAGPRERVVWCAACRRHETGRHRRWWASSRREWRPKPFAESAHRG